MTIRKIETILCCVLLVLALAAPAAFATPRLGSVTICIGVEGPELNPVNPTDSFRPDSPAVHAVAEIRDGAVGTKVAGAWISIDAISTPDYVISSTEMILDRAGTRNAHFHLTKPTRGWPVGNYGIDVYINGNKAGSPAFSIR